jgi:hypothetical protein
MKNNPNNYLPTTKGKIDNQTLDTLTIGKTTDGESLDIIAMYLLKAFKQKASNINQKESA